MSLILIAGQYPLFRLSVAQLVRQGSCRVQIEEASTLSDFSAQQLAKAKAVICCDNGAEISALAALQNADPRCLKVLFSDSLRRGHRHLLRNDELHLVLPMAVDLSQAGSYLKRLLKYREPLLGLSAMDDDGLMGHFLPDITNLTRRERRVVHFLGQGLSNEGIAEEMAIQSNTVKVYMARICRKTGVRNRTHVVSVCQHLLASGF